MVIELFIDNRSRYFAFVPSCVLSQALHAQGLVKYRWRAVVKPIVEVLIKNDINIIQMPCPESSYPTYIEGIRRSPKGYNSYDTKEYRNHCRRLAKNITDLIYALINNKYIILAIFGIAYSPTCAIKTQYIPGKGKVRKLGIFMEELINLLIRRSIRNLAYIDSIDKNNNVTIFKINEKGQLTNDPTRDYKVIVFIEIDRSHPEKAVNMFKKILKVRLSQDSGKLRRDLRDWLGGS